MNAAVTDPSASHPVKALATDWVRPFYFETFADALIHVTRDVGGDRMVQMKERYTRETPGFVQYGAIEDDDWVVIETTATGTGHPATFPVNAPCPDCGQFSVIGYYLQTEDGKHMHTHYVCNYWEANPPELLAKMTRSLTRPCGWHGWTVPTADPDGNDQDDAAPAVVATAQPDVLVAKMDELITAFQEAVFNQTSELSSELTHIRETVERLTPAVEASDDQNAREHKEGLDRPVEFNDAFPPGEGWKQ